MDPDFPPQTLSPAIDRACDDFEAAWRDGRRPRIEAFLAEVEEPERAALFYWMLVLELELREQLGERPAIAEYLDRFETHRPLVERLFREPRLTVGGDGGDGDGEPTLTRKQVPPPSPDPMESTRSATGPLGGSNGFDSTVALPSAERRAAGKAVEPLPERFGRYRPTRMLAQGGFGRVYLAHDDELDRPVAIKVLRAEALGSSGRVEALLDEARRAAHLRHPAIVTIHDVGRQDDGTVFVVMEYLEGRTLSQLLRAARPGPRRLAEMLARIADAVRDAHRAGLVHRDLKPSNILTDGRGEPYLADFGLAVDGDALRQKLGEVEGTPSYMAPEQVRGEAHRLDGRTDLWALGVILYQGLTGRHPFARGVRERTFEAILHEDPEPPRQLEPTAPRELERICLKCLAKRMADRYRDAAELAEDLRSWLAADAAGRVGSAAAPAPARVVPKGLRAFDADDAEFFLALLPGPRDRDGLPESIRFWKARIEERDGAKTFSVGLLYGPTGCGKSSFVKAGLLPRLGAHVRPVVVEATPEGTEARLLAALRREFPGLAGAGDLAEAVALLREGWSLPPGDKALIVLDQFEQWLHAHPDGHDDELVAALRQCDGGRAQALVLVRDDFWMAIGRFFKAVEVGLADGGNAAAVELFDAAHARRVLVELGRALGRLPRDGPTAADAARFLDRAVEGLAEPNGRIIPVRLVLFAEMVRDRPWTPATLRALGGIEGVGVTFLEETFCVASAPPAHRQHREAAQAVLKALLPEPASTIKGAARPADDLRRAAGYAERPDDFDALMRLLDTELRMVTPSEPDPDAPAAGTSYQLTHDYLIPALRQWLTRKQRETRRGRAELRLANLTALWRDRPDRRPLPAAIDWLEILWQTRAANWSVDERRMMRVATRHHVRRAAAAAALVVALTAVGLMAYDRWHAAALLRQTLGADFGVLPRLLPEVEQHRNQLRGDLERIEARPGADPRAREVAGVLLFLDRPNRDRADFLHARLPGAGPDELDVIAGALARHSRDAGADELAGVLGSDDVTASARLRAACALARVGPDWPGWEAAAPAVVRALLAEDRRTFGRWFELLDPVARRLLPALAGACREEGLDAATHALAAEAAAVALARSSDPALDLAHLAVAVPPEALPPLSRELARQRDRGRAVAFLEGVLAEHEDVEPCREVRAHRQANAALTLLILGRPDRLWPLLRHRDDPTLRALLIERLAEPEVDTRALLDRLRPRPADAAERQALLMALAEVGPDRLVGHARAEALDLAAALHRDDPDPGVHAAAELLLRRQKEPRRLAPRREAPGPRPGFGWYDGPNGHTFVVLRTPGAFLMGTPEGDPWYNHTEFRHVRRIDRSLAVATTETTLAQFLKFDPDQAGRQDETYGSSEPACPVANITWYQAARYCNWLSERAGIPRDQWCYPEPVEPGMVVPADAIDRAGYRLPTEPEWEYACRAGTLTLRPFGQTNELLSRYAWTHLNAGELAHPVARLLPNEFGLFDMLGNTWEWCHEGPPAAHGGTYEPDYTPGTAEHPAADRPGEQVLEPNSYRLARGGAFDFAPSLARSGRRFCLEGWFGRPYEGFRVVRTLPDKD
ncbi:MAG TPA: SUMF1/EgtB/PvdO family nonheme iron enzyme [Isosphaeraceae bacterium]|jgi:formylglycine-generating enzyme required for sulfatase activity/predicted Ser/Thr protein kinase|nr:SUMF1/EgtB/PvdO family nonheme iron enzyme [Isosphaeraceae bacterium]